MHYFIVSGITVPSSFFPSGVTLKMQYMNAAASIAAASGAAAPEEEEEQAPRGNILKLWGNQQTMNLNAMVYTNVTQSPYFKANLIELKTYHEVIDEIYYKVSGHPCFDPFYGNDIGGTLGTMGTRQS